MRLLAVLVILSICYVCVIFARSVRPVERELDFGGDSELATIEGNGGFPIRNNNIESLPIPRRLENIMADHKLFPRRNPLGKMMKVSGWGWRSQKETSQDPSTSARRRAVNSIKNRLRDAVSLKNKRARRLKMLDDLLVLTDSKKNLGVTGKESRDETTISGKAILNGGRESALENSKKESFPQTWASLFERQDNADKELCEEESKRMDNVKQEDDQEDDQEGTKSGDSDEAEELARLNLITYLKTRNKKKETSAVRPPRPGRDLPGV